MQKHAEFAELREEAFWVGKVLATHAEFQCVSRNGVLVRQYGGRCGDGDTNVFEPQTCCHIGCCLLTTFTKSHMDLGDFLDLPTELAG